PRRARTGSWGLATQPHIFLELSGGGPPAGGGPRLDALRDWLGRHQEQLIVTLSLVVGLWLMGASVYALVT
ncbi:GAP family protein, partial [Streptomyces sp. NPDC059783]